MCCWAPGPFWELRRLNRCSQISQSLFDCLKAILPSWETSSPSFFFGAKGPFLELQSLMIFKAFPQNWSILFFVKLLGLKLSLDGPISFGELKCWEADGDEKHVEKKQKKNQKESALSAGTPAWSMAFWTSTIASLVLSFTCNKYILVHQVFAILVTRADMDIEKGIFVLLQGLLCSCTGLLETALLCEMCQFFTHNYPHVVCL